MFVVGIAAVLAAIGVPAYSSVMERLKINKTIQDLHVIAQEVVRYKLPHDNQLPTSLAQLPGVPTTDPWGNAYEYLNFVVGPKNGIRKDHNLHPLNSEFDLYSKGPDGDSRSPLTAQASRDDILWARDGAFVGKAEEF
jgi:general secretion pathway protein G